MSEPRVFLVTLLVEVPGAFPISPMIDLGREAFWTLHLDNGMKVHKAMAGELLDPLQGTEP